ncbi:response regulator [Paenibacillus sp. TRM 82003]|nr:response regulator [Paenibacillus sp. TRM 82003]
MISLLIVEDERWEREGLVDLWDWRELGIEVAGAAVDGMDGFEKALRLKPDMILTDIRMPRMSGLEMSQKVRERHPDVRIVVLTGYSDFAYTREAIKMGADDYVLKPIEEDELRLTMLRVAEKCERIRERRLEESRTAQQLRLGERMKLERLLADLLFGRHGAASTLSIDAAALLEPELVATGYSVMAIIPREPMRDDAVRLLLERNEYIVRGDDLPGGFAVLASLDGQTDDIREAAMRRADRLSEAWADAGAGPMTAGLGVPATSLTGLEEAYRQAAEAARYGVFREMNGVVSWETLADDRKRFAERSQPFLARWKELTRQLRLNLLAVQKYDAHGVLEEMFAHARAFPGAGKETVGTLLNGLLIELSALEDDRSSGERPDAQELLALNRMSEMHAFAERYFMCLIDRLDAKRNRKDDYIADKTVRLIEERYGSSELSLTMLAEESFVSSNHLGVLFKKATGMTVHQYIMELRMRKAEELLRTTKRKVSEVAVRIGMSNHSYFCTLFKQKYGMSPGEYQELMQRR